MGGVEGSLRNHTGRSAADDLFGIGNAGRRRVVEDSGDGFWRFRGNWIRMRGFGFARGLIEDDTIDRLKRSNVRLIGFFFWCCCCNIEHQMGKVVGLG